MTLGAIPVWDAQGTIPPVDVASPTSTNRCPYVVSLSEVVLRFGSSVERRSILDGLLRYRAGLHSVGLARGFQWLDGSFLEHVELLENRPPNDIDVVTFYRLPSGATQAIIAQRAPELFPVGLAARQAFELRFGVDPYFVGLDAPAELIVERSTYWYSMWSHRRNGAWKGYVQIDLAPADDATAMILLASLTNPGAQP